MKQGFQQFRVGQFNETFQSWQQARKLYREIKDQLSEGQALGTLGNVYLSLGMYAEAIELQEQRLLISRETKNRREEENALGSLGTAHYFLGNYAKEIKYLEQVLTIARENQDRLVEGIALGRLGSAYQSLGNYAKAIEFHEQSLVVSREIKDRRKEGNALGNLGIAYYSLGNYTKAIEFHEQSLVISREIKDRFGEGKSLGNLGITYDSLGNYAKAIEFHERSLAIIRETTNRDAKIIAFNNIGTTLKKQRKFDLAIVFYKQSINVSESIRRDNSPLPRDIQVSYTETVARTYRELADLLISQGRIGEAQKVLELLKVQELNDITEGSRSPFSLSQIALSQVEQNIIQKHTSLIQFGQQLSECKQNNCAKLDEYKTTHRQLTEAYDKFIEDVKTQLVTDRDKSIAATTDDFIGGARKIVNNQPNTGLIYPLVLPDKIRILWATKGGALNQAECPLGESQLSKLVEDFRNALQTSYDLNPVQTTGKQLHNCLLPKKLRDELTKNKIDNLVFVPDRITNYIPMAALYDGKHT